MPFFSVVESHSNLSFYSHSFFVYVFSCIILIRPQILEQTTKKLSVVLPENPIILDRWGRIINRTTIGPMEEGDDVILSCRVVGGKLIFLLLHDVSSGTFCCCYFFKNLFIFARPD